MKTHPKSFATWCENQFKFMQVQSPIMVNLNSYDIVENYSYLHVQINILLIKSNNLIVYLNLNPSLDRTIVPIKKQKLLVMPW